jgi:uncharacterized damage-inducible protein DinB
METRDVLLDAFGRIREETVSAASDLSGEALTYRPDPDANSIGWLVWHLARVQDDHVSALARRGQAYVEDGWADRLGLTADATDLGYGHSSEQVAAVRFGSPDDLLAYHDAVTTYTQQYLTTVDAEELDRIVDERWNPPVSAGVRLVSVVSDCLQHAGQANYLRGLWERLNSIG